MHCAQQRLSKFYFHFPRSAGFLLHFSLTPFPSLAGVTFAPTLFLRLAIHDYAKPLLG